MKLKFLSLFSGIGGFDLGLERAGMECVGQVEINPFCQKVLAHHWPHVKITGDIRDVKLGTYGSVDLICGGFPCQPFSTAGKRKGKNDDRYLWPEMLRVIKTYRPSWVIGENVAGIVNMALDTVLSDLEKIGYECQSFIIPACAVDAPHRRDRVWIIGHATGASNIVAYSESEGLQGGSRDSEGEGREILPPEQNNENQMGSSSGCVSGSNGREENVPDTKCLNDDDSGHGTSQVRGEQQKQARILRMRTWEPEPNVGRVAHGISNRVDRLRSLGNAVVPQVVEEIGKAIILAEEYTRGIRELPLEWQGPRKIRPRSFSPSLFEDEEEDEV